jgi:hypothetical protein
VVLWDGEPITTSVLSNSELLFTVAVDNIKQDGPVEVRVQIPNLEDAPSNALTFMINNPVPEVTSLAPNGASAGSGGGIISVSGQDFDG